MVFKSENTHSHSFKIRKISIEETEKELKTTRSDCTTGDDTPVELYNATPLIINNFIQNENIQACGICKDKFNTENLSARTTFRLQANICITRIVENIREISSETDC